MGIREYFLTRYFTSGEVKAINEDSNQSGGVRKTVLLLAFAAAAVYATFYLIVVTR